MELDAREGAALDGGDNRPVMLRLGGDKRAIDGLARVRMGKVDVRAVETASDAAAVHDSELVPAHVRDAARFEPAHRSGEDPQAEAALLALLEEELHADADPEHGPVSRDPAAQRGVQAEAFEPTDGGRDVTHTRDDGQIGSDDTRRVARDQDVSARTLEGRSHAAHVPRAVVRQNHLHATPFVELTPAPSRAHASRSARPSALNAASATWWSSAPAASTCSVTPAWTAKRSSACGSSVTARPPTRSPLKARTTSA